MNEDGYKPHVKRRAKHPNYEQNRARVDDMLAPNYGPAFMQEHHHCRMEPTGTKTIFLNPVDYDFIDRRKWCLSLTNEDILKLMHSLSNGAENITLVTLNRKLKGHVDFTAAEILLLGRILDLTPDEILSVFRLHP